MGFGSKSMTVTNEHPRSRRDQIFREVVGLICEVVYSRIDLVAAYVTSPMRLKWKISIAGSSS